MEEEVFELMEALPLQEQSQPGDAEIELMRLAPVLDALKARYGEDVEAETLAALILRGLEKEREDTDKACRHLLELMAQEGELQSLVPGFSLMEALEDERLLRLSAPHTGLSLRQAWELIHGEEIGRAAARESLEKISRSIRSGGARPRESGGSAVVSIAPAAMTKRQRAELKRRIYAAAANGGKIYP